MINGTNSDGDRDPLKGVNNDRDRNPFAPHWKVSIDAINALQIEGNGITSE